MCKIVLTAPLKFILLRFYCCESNFVTLKNISFVSILINCPALFKYFLILTLYFSSSMWCKMQTETCICFHASLHTSLLNSPVFKAGLIKCIKNLYSLSLEAPLHFSHWPLSQKFHYMQEMLTEKQYTCVLFILKAITTKHNPFKFLFSLLLPAESLFFLCSSSCIESISSSLKRTQWN